MSKILCVTNASLCKTDFLDRIETIVRCHPAGIILREKALTPEQYRELAVRVVKICETYEVPCILHSFTAVAEELHVPNIHMPLPVLRKMNDADRKRFSVLGASCHSVEDAMEAEQLGCTYITAGHIFATDCKKGLEPRGITFLNQVCRAVKIPVYAIGGISAANFDDILKAGAAGGCVMSGLMQCDSPEEFLAEFKERNLRLHVSDNDSHRL